MGKKMTSSQDLVTKTSSVVIKHLNKFGACVIDNFLGQIEGGLILEEVLMFGDLQLFQVLESWKT